MEKGSIDVGDGFKAVSTKVVEMCVGDKSEMLVTESVGLMKNF